MTYTHSTVYKFTDQTEYADAKVEVASVANITYTVDDANKEIHVTYEEQTA